MKLPRPVLHFAAGKYYSRPDGSLTYDIGGQDFMIEQVWSLASRRFRRYPARRCDPPRCRLVSSSFRTL